MSDVDFSQVNGVRIPDGEVKYIVAPLNAGDRDPELVWRRPNEFPYVIGACTISYSDWYTREEFSLYYIEKYEEPIYVANRTLPTY